MSKVSGEVVKREFCRLVEASCSGATHQQLVDAVAQYNRPTVNRMVALLAKKSADARIAREDAKREMGDER